MRLFLLLLPITGMLADFPGNGNELAQRGVLNWTDYVRLVVFAPDSSALCTIASRIKVLDLKSMEEKGDLGRPVTRVNAAVICEKNKVLILGRVNKIEFWELGKKQRLVEALDSNFSIVHSLALSGDGDTLVSASMQNITLWDLKKKQPFFYLPSADGQVFAVALTQDGSLLLWGGGSPRITKQPQPISDFGNVTLWDVNTKKEAARLKGHTGDVCCVAFGPGGKLAASGSADKTVIIWDTKVHKAKHILKGHTDTVTSIAFDKDGKWLASGSSDGTVKLWDVEAGEVKYSMKASSAVRSVAISPDGKLLAAGGDPGKARVPVIVWDMPAAAKEKR